MLSPNNQGALGFAHYVRCMAGAKGDPHIARMIAEKTAPETTKLVFKAGVPSTGTGDAFTAADTPLAVLAAAMLASIANLGVFDRMARDATQLPFRQRLMASSAVMEAVLVDENKPTPMMAIPLVDLDAGLVPFRVASMTAITSELARVPATAEHIQREMARGVALGTDRKFLADLVDATTPISSSGVLLNDIAALIDGCTLNAASKPFFVFDMNVVKKMVLARGAELRLFPDVALGNGVMCGEIAGIPLLASDALPSGEGSTALLVDAAQLFVQPGDGVSVTLSTSAAIEMSDAPTNTGETSTGADLVSAFQSDLVAILAACRFGYAIARPEGAASLSDVSY